MIIAVFIVGAVASSALQLLLLQPQDDTDYQPQPARISVMPHSPIAITSDLEFTLDNGVKGGAGTSSNPFVISDWAIDATTAPGIFITGTTLHFIILNVTVNSTRPDYSGIVFQSLSNARVHNVTISDCLNGISLEGSCNYVGIDDSSISNSSLHGIVSQYGSADHVNITLNTVFNNVGTGIRLSSTTNFNIIGNNVSTNDTSSVGRLGIQLLESSNGVVTGNNVTAAYDEAMTCKSSHDVIVVGNRFSSGYYDLKLDSCYGFLIYHNNFVGQLLNVPEHGYDNGGTANLWNATWPTGGNYWIEYTGMDVKGGPNQDEDFSDGIGDAPYVFNVSQMDHYPLMTSGPIEPIPEFPTVLLPIISVLALLFVVIRRYPRREF